MILFGIILIFKVQAFVGMFDIQFFWTMNPSTGGLKFDQYKFVLFEHFNLYRLKATWIHSLKLDMGHGPPLARREMDSHAKKKDADVNKAEEVFFLDLDTIVVEVLAMILDE